MLYLIFGAIVFVRALAINTHWDSQEYSVSPTRTFSVVWSGVVTYYILKRSRLGTEMVKMDKIRTRD